MQHSRPWWSLEQLDSLSGGLRIMDFHPIHVYLNSASMEGYERAKHSGTALWQLTESDLQPYVNYGRGTGSIFSAVVDRLKQAGSGSRVCDLLAVRQGGGD